LQSNSYEDIINLPHYQSATRAHMSNHDRAAQFSPFAALTGYGDAVKETARLTDSRVELDEYGLDKLNERLNWIGEHISEQPEVSITEILRQYFINHPQSIDKYTFLQNSAFTHWVKEKCSKMC